MSTPWTHKRITEFFRDKADPKLVGRFAEYHHTYANVYVEFVSRALRVCRVRQSYSQRTIIESMRWDYDMRAGATEPFKINNDYVALMVRMAIADHPDKLGDFFELRRINKKPYVGSELEGRRRARIQEGTAP